MTTKLLGALFLLLAFAGIAFGVGALTFYRGGYEPPAPIQAELPEQSPPVVPGNTVWESPVDHRDSGLFLIDALHRNAFTPNHVSALRSKVADLGFDVEFLGGFGNVKEEDRLPLLEEKLRVADSFAVILPRVDYTAAEAALVENFVRKGGKLPAHPRFPPLALQPGHEHLGRPGMGRQAEPLPADRRHPQSPGRRAVRLAARDDSHRFLAVDLPDRNQRLAHHLDRGRAAARRQDQSGGTRPGGGRLRRMGRRRGRTGCWNCSVHAPA